jgi:hypothetical protein
MICSIMGEQLITIHLIEEGSNGGEALFEVALVLDDETRAALLDRDAGQWRSTLARAQRMIRAHVAHRQASDERV